MALPLPKPRRKQYIMPILFSVLLLTGLGAFLYVFGSELRSLVPPGAILGAGGTVTFTVAGDFGDNGESDRTLAGMGQNADFALAAGDFSYSQSGPEPTDGITPSPWCNYVKQLIPGAGSTFPFQLAMGNHEQDDATDGRIANFAVCLPNLMNNAVSSTVTCGTRPFNDGLNGCYGIAYYFDYPAILPIARFIVVYHTTTSQVQGQVVNYDLNSPRYLWLSSVIDDAKARGLWTVAVTHKPYFSVGGSGQSGGDMHKLFAAKHVDLVITGHDHDYQRSKQMTCGSFSTYTASCISDDGLDGSYTKGTGTVFSVVGTGGNGLHTVGTNPVQNSYFVTWSGSSVNPTYGFLKVTLDANGLLATFINTGGTYTDTFSIGTAPPPPPTAVNIQTVSATPSTVTLGQTIAFSASVAGGTPPYAYNWMFGDGTPVDLTTTPSHVYQTAGVFTATVTVLDSLGQYASKTTSVTINGIAISVAFTNQNGGNLITLGGDFAWEIWKGGQLVTTSVNGATIDITSLSDTYEYRRFFHNYRIGTETFTGQMLASVGILEGTAFIYSHNSKLNGRIAFNNTVQNFQITTQNSTRLKFSVTGLAGVPYRFIVEVPKVPIWVQRDNTNTTFTFDRLYSIVIVDTIGLSTWDILFETPAGGGNCELDPNCDPGGGGDGTGGGLPLPIEYILILGGVSVAVITGLVLAIRRLPRVPRVRVSVR